MKKIIVTSGGSQEYVDSFRVLTNVSTGALGVEITELLARPDVEVDFVRTKRSKDIEEITKVYRPVNEYEVSSAQDAMECLETLVPKADAIIHAMAVADFGFRKDESIKLKSDDPEAFIEYMRQRIVVNPKIISNFRKWNTNPNFYIVGFKFEIDKTKEELCDIAHKSLVRNGCNIVVANDKAEMKREGEHVGHIVSADKSVKTIRGGKSILAQTIIELVLKGI